MPQLHAGPRRVSPLPPDPSARGRLHAEMYAALDKRDGTCKRASWRVRLAQLLRRAVAKIDPS